MNWISYNDLSALFFAWAESRLGARHRMLAEEREKLWANPDLDPVRRTRVLAEFVREDRRAIEACNRL
jgi:hypothetical protein